jgi:hypothetical protein
MPLASDIRKIAFLGDYLPGKCGIATFASDVLSALPCEIACATAPHPTRNIISQGERREFLLVPWNKEHRTLLTLGTFYSTGRALWNKGRKTLLTLGAFYFTGRDQTWSWTRRENQRASSTFVVGNPSFKQQPAASGSLPLPLGGGEGRGENFAKPFAH